MAEEHTYPYAGEEVEPWSDGWHNPQQGNDLQNHK